MTTDQQYQSCLNCLTRFYAMTANSPLSVRRKSQLEVELFQLLQFLTIEKNTTIETANKSDLEAWLNPSKPFTEYDLRLELLSIISKFTPNLVRDFGKPHRPDRIKTVLEFLFWRRKHQKMELQTRAFFQSITQEQILSSEIKCVPFYKALHGSNSERDTSGAFNESDDEIIKLIKAYELGSEPKITDLGCGGGRLLKRLRQEFPSSHLTGTSIFSFSENDLLALSESEINPIYSASSNTGIPDASQDIVFSTEVIEHLRNPDEMAREIHRILKPGGIFCVTAPSTSAQMYCKNPLSYIFVAFGTIFPKILPRFHNLYAPLTPIRIVHYAFHPKDFHQLFAAQFSDFKILTRRFIALKKFRLNRVAASTPILRLMGGLCVAIGRKNVD